MVTNLLIFMAGATVGFTVAALAASSGRHSQCEECPLKLKADKEEQEYIKRAKQKASEEESTYNYEELEDLPLHEPSKKRQHKYAKNCK